MKKLNPKEAEEILNQPFDVWKRLPDKEYGAREHQLSVFLNLYSLALRRQKHHTHDQDNLLIIGGRRCLGKGTPVLMFDGSVKAVEDVQVGEFLMGPDSLPRMVSVLHRGQDDMFRVTPTNGTPWVCNSQHKLSLKTSGMRCGSYRENGKRKEIMSNGELVSITVEEFSKLSKRKQSHLVQYSSQCLTFPELQDVPIDPYFLGVWLGDGRSDGPAVTTMDPEIVRSLYDIAEQYGLGVSVYSDGRSKASSYRPATTGGRPNPITEIFRNLELINNKHIPEQFILGSIRTRLSVLAGLIDTDGYHHTIDGNGYYEITQKNEKLARDIVFLARSLGFQVSIKPVTKYCVYKGEKRTGTYYRVNIMGDISQIPCRIPRKVARPWQAPRLKYKSTTPITGIKVEPIGMGDYYGFTLDGPDNRFILADDFAVTENSGKSAMAVACMLTYMMKFPGLKVIVGGLTFTDLKDTIIEEYLRPMFTVRTAWDSPFLANYPTEHNKYLRLINGSQAKFMHFSEFENLRGKECDMGLIDEGSRLKDRKGVEELIRSMSSPILPVKQVIVTTNPPEGRNWMFDMYGLDQDRPDYVGPKMPRGGERCKCHLCKRCRDDRNQMVPYIKGECPECGHLKISQCDGDQEWTRVLRVNASQNDIVRVGYLDDVKDSQDANTFRVYGLGELVELRDGKVFKSFSEAVGSGNLMDGAPAIENYHPDINPNGFRVALNPNAPIHWTFDWNVHYECSAIIQATKTAQGILGEQVDEIVLPDSGPEAVAKEFCRRYPGFKPPVYLFGDPNGLNKGTDFNQLSNFEVVRQYLEKAGYDVHLMVEKREKETLIPVAERINASNRMFCNANGLRRYFIAQHCKYSINSLAGTKYMEGSDNKPRIDKSQDKIHDKDTDKKPDWSLLTPKQRMRFTPPILTHPGEAIGYWIVQMERIMGRDPMQDAFFYFGPNNIVKVNAAGRVVEEDYSSPIIRPTPSIWESMNHEHVEHYSMDDWGFNPF